MKTVILRGRPGITVFYINRRHRNMAIDKVKEYFKAYGMEDRILEFPVSSATVELAAEAVGCEPCRIAKTLSFMANDFPILIVAAGDAKIDNHKYKEKFAKKAKMLTPEEAEQLVGHAVGGVCPFAVNEGVTVYLDESLKRFETVFPACGSSNSAIGLTIEELEKYSSYTEMLMYVNRVLPVLKDTEKMINASALSKMKDGVIILNFARDLLVDDDAMADALASGSRSRKPTVTLPAVSSFANTIRLPSTAASTAAARLTRTARYILRPTSATSVRGPSPSLQITAAILLFSGDGSDMVKRST